MTSFDVIKPFNFSVDFTSTDNHVDLSDLSLMVESFNINILKEEIHLSLRIFVDKPLFPLLLSLKDKGILNVVLSLFNSTGEAEKKLVFPAPKIVSCGMSLSYLYDNTDGISPVYLVLSYEGSTVCTYNKDNALFN